MMCKCEVDAECIDGAAPGIGVGPTCDATAGYCKFTCAADADCVAGQGLWYCNSETPGYEFCMPYCAADKDCIAPMYCTNIVDGKGNCACP
jgi:hypothetical protein